MNLAKVDYLRVMLDKFYMYPSSALWRAIELNLLSKLDYQHNSSILDLGCGNGYFSHVLVKDKNLKIEAGIDISRKAISKARKLNEKRQTYKTLMAANAGNLPYEKKSFSTVFSNCAIEHIPNLEDVLSEVYRVLKDNGRFIFTVPSPHFGRYSYIYSFFEKRGLSKIAKRYINHVNKKLAHYNCFEPETWKRCLKLAGLELVEYKYYITSEVAKIFDILEFIYTLGIWKFRINAFLMRFSCFLESLGVKFHKKLLIKVCYDFLKRYIEVENKSNGNMGAAILLIAEKRSAQIFEQRA